MVDEEEDVLSHLSFGDAPPSEQAYVREATGERPQPQAMPQGPARADIDPEEEDVLSHLSFGDPATPAPIAAEQPEYEPTPEPIAPELAPAIVEPEEDTPWYEDMYHFFTGGTGTDKTVKHTRTTEAIPITTGDRDMAVLYAEKLGEAYTADTPGTMAAGASYAGGAISEFFGAAREQGQVAIRDPYRTPIDPGEEFMSWEGDLRQRRGQMPMTPERVLSAIETLENKIDLEAGYAANKQGFWHTIAHPMAKEDRLMSERRIGQFQALIDVLETSRYRPENTVPNNEPMALQMAFSVGAEEGTGKRVGLFQDDVGQLRATVTDYRDPLVGKSTLEQAAMLGIDDVLENTYKGAAQTLAAFPVLAKMAMVDAPVWIYDNLEKDTWARWEIENAGDDLSADKNIEIMQNIMRGMGVEPGSHEEMKAWGKIDDQGLESYFRLEGMGMGQLAGYIEARDKLDTVQSKYLRALDEGTTWDAPVKGAKAAWESISSEVDDYGVGGYFLQHPIDLLGLISVTGTVARLPARLLAKTAPVAKTISGTAATAAASPNLAKRVTSALGPEARALLPEGEQLVGGRAFDVLKKGLTEADGKFAMSAAQEAEAMSSLRAAHVMRKTGTMLENFDPITFALHAPGMAARSDFVHRQFPEVRHWFSKEGPRNQPIKWGDEQTTLDAVITANKTEFDRFLTEIRETAQDMPSDEQVLEAIHKTLNVAAQKDGVTPQYMFVQRNPSNQAGPMPVSLDEAHQRSWADANLKIDPEAQAFGAIRNHANDRIGRVTEQLDATGKLDLDSRWTQVVDGKSSHAVWKYLQHRFDGHPAFLEQLGERADELLDLKKALADETAKKPKERTKGAIPKLKKSIAKHDKALRKWGESTLKKLEDPDATILSGLADHMNTFGKQADQIGNTNGLPSLASMAHHLAQGKALNWVPAHHIALAKTIKSLRHMQQTEPEAFAKVRINHGEHRFTGEQMLRRFDNFDAANNYLDMLDQEFNVSALDNMDVVYSERLPLGLDKIDIGQMNDTARHSMAARKLLLHGGMESVRVGNLAESTFWRNVEGYTPHFYQQYMDEFTKAGIENPDQLAESLSFMVQNGYNGSHYQRAFTKAMYNVAEREMMGLVTNPKVYLAKGLHTIANDIQFKKFAQGLKGAVSEDGIPLLIDPKTTPESQIPKHYIQAGRNKRLKTFRGVKKPYSERWLDLEGMYMDPEVHHYLKATRRLDDNGMFAWFNREIMNRWKFGKTILNPPGQVRNVFSNNIMATMAGLNPFLHRSAKSTWKGTLDEYVKRDMTKGSVIDKAMEGGLFGTDFVSAELRGDLREIWEAGRIDVTKLPEPTNMPELGVTIMEQYSHRIQNGLRKVFDKAKDGYRAGADRAAWSYTAGDELFKLWRFKQVLHLQKEFRNTGKITREMRRVLGDDNKFLMEVLDQADGAGAYRAAAKEAHRWFFDYTDVPGWVEFTRKSAMPFFTYSYKAVPRVAKWLNDNPAQSFMWRQTFDYMNFTNEFMYGEQDFESIYETQEARAQLPGWSQATAVAQPTGKARDFDVEKQRYTKRGIRRSIKKGVEMAPYWDVQYWTQLGGLYNAPEPERGIGALQRVANATIQHPLWTSVWSLANRPEWDKYGTQGGRIWKDEDSSFIALNKWGKQMWRTWTPPYMPGLPSDGRDEHGRKIDYQKVGAGLIAGGGSWQKLMAKLNNTPDYRVERGISKLRQWDELAGEMLAYRLDWRETDPNKLRRDLRDIKKSIRRDRDTALRGIERGDREARKEIIREYDEKFEMIENVHKQQHRHISAKALRFTRAVKKASD